MSNHPEMDDVVNAVRALVKALKKRQDIRVDVAKLGRKAPKGQLANAQDRLGGVLKGELLSFYERMNGAEVRWTFLEGDVGGHLLLRPLNQLSFEGEGEHFMGFGPDEEALFLDGTGDTGSWLVRPKGSNDSGEIVFAAAAEGADGIRLGDSFADYLSRAIEAGFVVNWPGCTGREGGLYGRSEQALRKFKAPPIKPKAIRAGVRVQFRSFCFPGRGEVLETMQVAQDVMPSYMGANRRFARVALDIGVTAWMPEDKMKVAKKGDMYERLRGNVERGEQTLSAFLDDIVCAIGPTGSGYGGIGASNATRGAALLAPYPLDDAFRLVLDLHDIVVADGVDLDEVIRIEATRKKDLFADVVKPGAPYQRSAALVGLLNGAELLARYAATTSARPYGELLHSDIRERLMAYGEGTPRATRRYIRTLCDNMESPPRTIGWATDNQNMAKMIGLAEGESLFVG